MYDDARHNVHVIPCAFGGAETSGWFAKKVRKPEDIKGLRMRGFGLGRVMSRLGATTVLVPGGSLGNAFDKHEIDAAAFLTPAVDQRQRVQDHGTLKREGSTRGRARTASGAVRATDWSSNTR